MGTDKELSISRILNAPRELVWEAWTDPEHIKHWWGPEGFTNTIHVMEVKEGGVWEFVMHGPDGKDYRNKHIFKEIVKPEKLVLQHITAPAFTMYVSFEEQGNKTMLTIRSEFESAEQLKQVIAVFQADKGFVQNVDRLEAYLAKLH